MKKLDKYLMDAALNCSSILLKKDLFEIINLSSLEEKVQRALDLYPYYSFDEEGTGIDQEAIKALRTILKSCSEYKKTVYLHLDNQELIGFVVEVGGKRLVTNFNFSIEELLLVY